MKKFMAVALAGAGIFGLSGVSAADGTITITGQVTDAACLVSVNGGTNDATIVMPAVSKDSLATPGDFAGATSIVMSLSACPVTGTVRAYFSPENVDQATGNLTNNAVGTPAENVQVQVLSDSGAPIDLRDNTGNPYVAFVDQAGAGVATLNYAVRYTAVGAAATAGTVDTALIYTLDYQ